MSDSFEFTLHSPLTEEDWGRISDAEYENTMFVTFHTPQGKQVRYIKCEVLDKIRAEIEANRWTDKNIRIERNALASGLDKALEIIDKYKAESEVRE